MISALLVSLVLTASDAGVLLSKPVTVSADKLDYLKKESRAVYRGHAVAKRDAMTMTCDELEAFFAPNGEIQRIVARGNVYAIDGDREAWGDEAEFINETGVYVDGIEMTGVQAVLAKNRVVKIEGLFNVLSAKRELWLSINPNKVLPGNISFWVDARTPSLVVKSALKTAAFAGFPLVTFVVKDRTTSKLVAVDTPDNLTSPLRGSETMYLQLDAQGDEAAAVLQRLAGDKRVAVADTKQQTVGFEIDTETGHDVRRELAAAVVGRGWGLLEMRPMRMSLEEIFLHVTTEDVAAPPAVAEASHE